MIFSRSTPAVAMRSANASRSSAADGGIATTHPPSASTGKSAVKPRSAENGAGLAALSPGAARMTGAIEET